MIYILSGLPSPEHEKVIEVTHPWDLGVILSSEMQFLKNVEQVIPNINKKMEWILHTYIE